MNKGKSKRSLVNKLIREVVPLLDCSPSVDRFLCTVENFELNIQSLEARVECIQQEIEVLISEQ